MYVPAVASKMALLAMSWAMPTILNTTLMHGMEKTSWYNVTRDALQREWEDDAYRTSLSAGYRSQAIPEYNGGVRLVDAKQGPVVALELTGQTGAGRSERAVPPPGAEAAQNASGRHILVLVGPPGAGKGTHAPKLAAALGVPHLSVGDMVRAEVAAGTPVGLRAKNATESGALLSDDIVLGIMKDRIRRADCGRGFILDGFPRTLGQVQGLDAMLSRSGERVSQVIALHVPDAVLEERVTGRWIHKASGRSYHVKFAPPASLAPGAAPTAATMRDDETGGALQRRSDDTADVLRTRLSGYHNQTVPILHHYSASVAHIDANRPPPAVWRDIASKLRVPAQ